MTVLVLLLKAYNNYLIKWHLDVWLEDVVVEPQAKQKASCAITCPAQTPGLSHLSLPQPDAHCSTFSPSLCPSSV